MRLKSLAKTSDAVLLRELEEVVAEEERNKKLLAAHIAEVRDRELFKEAGYDSIEAYCEGELGLSMDDLPSLGTSGDRDV